MAKILTILKSDTPESIQKKVQEWSKQTIQSKGFPAHQFTGKILSYGDAVVYQRQLRNEWD